MFSLRCMTAFTGSLRTPITSTASRGIIRNPLKRTLTSLTPRRPTLSISPTTNLDPATSLPLEKSLISTHPSFIGTTIRGGKRWTFDPSHFVRKRRHGFLSRLRTKKGRAILRRRREKGRGNLSH